MLRPRTSRGAIALFGRLSAPLRLVLASQFAFNVGFYLVVPFLAAHLANGLALAGWMVGLVLGLRTFSQQGMFFLGGALADRFGVRRTIIAGCLVRIAGFLVLAVARDLPTVIAGVVLVGLAAALFSPATESAIVAWGREAETKGGPALQEVVGLEIVMSKLGSVVGPVLGGLVLVVPFETTCWISAVLFGVIAFAHVLWLPRDAHTSAPRGVSEVLRNKRFLIFAAIHASYLLSYNQLYLAMPYELDRIGAPSGNITWFFGLAALITIAAQMPVTRMTLAWSRARTFGLGYAGLALAFLAGAVGAAFPPLPGLAAYLPLTVFVVALHLGQTLVLPEARHVVAELTGGKHLGSYLGMLASAGGVAVLAGSTAIGTILPWAGHPGPAAPIPWALLAVPPALSSIAAVAFSRGRTERKSHETA